MPRILPSAFLKFNSDMMLSKENAQRAIPWGAASVCAIKTTLMLTLMVCSLSTIAHADILTGLTAYYKMDSTSGTTAIDSANGNHGTLSDGAYFTPAGKNGSGIVFPEYAGRVTAPHNAALSSTSFTMAAWVAQGPYGWNRIVAKNTAAGQNYYMHYYQGFGLVCGFYDGTTDREFSDSDYLPSWDRNYPPQSGDWKHVVCTFDNTTKTMNLYENGALIGTTTLNYTPQTGTGNLSVGWVPYTGNSTDGTLDEVRIYNRALTGSDVSELYGAASSSVCGGPSGNTGDISFNSAYGVMQTCDGSSWNAWAKSWTGAGTWKYVSPFTYHTCGIKADDTLWCWGENGNGQLGIGSTTDSSVPVQVSGGGTWIDVDGDEDVNPANGHTCGIKTNGVLYCWGINTSSQSGTGGGNIPAVAATGTWKDVEVAVGYSCGIRTDDSLWCWGSDSTGQRGDGGGAGANTATPVRESSNSTWKQVTINNMASHVCAIKSDDTAWCWGSNTFRQLGDGTGTTRYSPSAVSTTGVTTWKWISTGRAHTCGIKTDDTAWCWGTINNGELGNGLFSGTFNTPQPVTTTGLTTWNKIKAGDVKTCGVKTDGTGWCWGYGGEGNIGDGAVTDRNVPTREATMSLWNDIQIGWGACGVKLNGTLWCWGENQSGGLGLGDTSQRNTPVLSGPTTTCTTPVGAAGDLIYNTTHRVLQYCDGNIWQAAGRAGTGPNSGCTSPSGTAGNVIYNNTLNVTQYCDGDTWVGLGPAALACNDVPNAMTYAPAISQPPGIIQSTIVQVTGVGCATVPVSISGTGTAQFRVCSNSSCSSVVRAYSAAATTVSNGQYIQIRFTAANMPGAIYMSNLAVGNGGGSFAATVANWKFIFITSVASPTNGNLGGLAGADNWCNSLASAAGLPGTYMAWLSTNAADTPALRFNTTHGLAYRQPDAARTTIASSWAVLTSGTLANRVSATESGGSSSGANNVFTNVTTAGGNKSTTNNCSNWTSTTGTAQVGSNNSATSNWTDSATAACNSAFVGNLYCVQQ